MPKADGTNSYGLVKENAICETDLELLNIIMDPQHDRINLCKVKIAENILTSKISRGEIIGDELMLTYKNAFHNVYSDNKYLEIYKNPKLKHLSSGSMPNREIFDSRFSKFTFQAASTVSVFVITYSDLFPYLNLMQDRIVNDFLRKSTHRYNMY